MIRHTLPAVVAVTVAASAPVVLINLNLTMEDLRSTPFSADKDISSLHDVVLDYINANAYSATAKVLCNSPSPMNDQRDYDDGTMEIDSPPLPPRRLAKRAMRESSIDGATLLQIQRRRVILNHILNGAILKAVDALDMHFPLVLSEPISLFAQPPILSPPSASTSSQPHSHSLPVFAHSVSPAHVRLNLQIQQFIESFRQLAPASPSSSSPSSSISSLNGNGNGNGTASTSSSMTLTHALTAAQGLHSEAKKLKPDDRAIYLQEIKDVGALFAYTDPETSILKGFLEQSRRISLAQQVNRAILHRAGFETTSQLENYARRVSALYAIMANRDIDPRPPWTGFDGGLGKEQFWKHHFKQGFNLSEFVNHTWS
ncbi:hypothetical protein P7C73_g4801, partial [Tremellales sp. Uapishka_1]